MKVVQFAVAAVAVIGGMLSSFGAPRYRVELTTSGYAGTETLANFPVLVKFAKDAPVGFDYSQFQPGQTDLSFEDASGNKLAYEIDTWDEEGTSFIWVKVPELTAATKIIAKWGDPDATADRGAVWSAAGYAGVWHMGETENQGTEAYVALDASGNGMTAEPMKSGTTDFTPMVSKADGAVGRARVNQDAADRKICLKVDGYNGIAAEIAEQGTLAVSGWFNVGGNNGNARLFAQKKYWSDADGFEIQQNGSARTGGSSVNVNGAFGTLTVGQWYHVAFVIRGAEASSVYLNGVEKKSGVLPALVAGNYPFTIGNDGDCNEVNYVGSYDEVRLLKGAVSTDWIKAEYDTVATATFYESSAVVDAGSFNTFTVETEIDAAGTLVPTAGVMTGLADGETVPFSAPETEFPSGDGYLIYTGYRLFVTVPGEAEKLVREVSELSGSYTHVEDQAARLVWKQTVRKGGASFETGFASIVQVPGYTADATLRNMQVLFRLKAGAPEGFSYADCQANGADILFTDADGHVVPHEIEKWNPEGESLIWVNLPKLQKGTTFRFCYGNADVTEPLNTPSDAWVDAGYAGVWHMNEAEASDSAVDATANGNDGAPEGADATQMVSTDGAIGGARVIATSCVNRFSVPDAESLDLGASFTVSAWIRGTGSTNARIFDRKSIWNGANGWEIQWNGATGATPRGSAGDVSGTAKTVLRNATDWAHVVWVYDGESVATYAGGEKVGDNPITPVVDNDLALKIGGIHDGADVFKGSFDEVRLVRGTTDVARIKADYDTVADPDFLFAMKVVAAADSNVFLVEPGDAERGTVVPAWGKTMGLEDGQVVNFSAPAGGQTTDDPKTNFCFTGYELYVTVDGVERLAEKKDAVAGRYAHAEGQSARLVWFTRDMPLVTVDVGEGGTVTGAGYYVLGETVTLTAVPAAGMRFTGWSGDLPEGIREYDMTVSFTADRAYAIAATFAEKSVCAAFFSWKGHAEGEAVTVETAGNDIGTETFTASSVSARNAGGALPAFSKYHPAKVIYSDALRNDVLTTDPGSIYFTSTAANRRSAGGDVIFDNFGTWISQQESCTLEFFIQAEVYQQYASAWSMILSGETQIFFAPDSGENVMAFSVEKSVSGKTGRATPTDGATCFVAGSWQHVALVYDRDSQKVTCYRNYGAGAEKSLVIAETTDNVKFCLGSQHLKSDSNFFNGWISCLRLTKGALTPREFMRADVSDDADGTIALWDFRGKAGTTVGALKAIVGDRELFKAAAASADPEKAPRFSDDLPGAAIYAGAAAMEAHQPLSKRVGAIAFTGTTDDYLTFPNLSTAVSDCDDFTLEFFEKCESTSTWKAAISWNDAWIGGVSKPFEVQIPGLNAKSMRIQCNFRGDSADLTKTANLSDGNWHHVAVTYTKADDKYTLWYDREKGPSITSRGLHQHTAAPLILGTVAANTGAELFVGKLSCLRISKHALQPGEFMVAGPKPPSGFSILVR